MYDKAFVVSTQIYFISYVCICTIQLQGSIALGKEYIGVGVYKQQGSVMSSIRIS